MQGDLLEDGLRVDLVPELTREGQKQWRAEVRDADGTLLEASAPTIHPRAAIADGEELLRQARDRRMFLDAHAQARRLFPAA